MRQFRRSRGNGRSRGPRTVDACRDSLNRPIRLRRRLGNPYGRRMERRGESGFRLLQFVRGRRRRRFGREKRQHPCEPFGSSRRGRRFRGVLCGLSRRTKRNDGSRMVRNSRRRRRYRFERRSLIVECGQHRQRRHPWHWRGRRYLQHVLQRCRRGRRILWWRRIRRRKRHERQRLRRRRFELRPFGNHLHFGGPFRKRTRNHYLVVSQSGTAHSYKRIHPSFNHRSTSS